MGARRKTIRAKKRGPEGPLSARWGRLELKADSDLVAAGTLPRGVGSERGREAVDAANLIRIDEETGQTVRRNFDAVEERRRVGDAGARVVGGRRAGAALHARGDGVVRTSGGLLVQEVDHAADESEAETADLEVLLQLHVDLAEVRRTARAARLEELRAAGERVGAGDVIRNAAVPQHVR